MCLGSRYRTCLMSVFGRLEFCLITRCLENLCIPDYRVLIIICRTWSYFIAHVGCCFAPLGGHISDKEVEAQGNKIGSIGVTWRGIRVSVVAFGKAVSVTYFECVFVALVIYKAKRLRRFMLSSLARPILPYFWTLSHKGHDFGGKCY